LIIYHKFKNFTIRQTTSPLSLFSTKMVSQ